MIGTYDLLNFAAVAGVVLVLGYTATLVWRVRKALAIPVYRNQAFGIVLIAMLLAFHLLGRTANAYVYYGTASKAIGNGGYGLFFVLLLTIFYWVDSSVLTARRSDPLSRDILSWTKLRIVLWAIIIPGPAIVIPTDFFLFGGASGEETPLFSAVGLILVPAILVPPVAGAILLPLAVRRAKDPAIRRHFLWFGAFASTFLLNLFVQLVPNLAFALSWIYSSYLAEAYFLYRSALSLTPVPGEPGS